MSKIRHQSHELPGVSVSSPRYGIAIFSPDDRLLHYDAGWAGRFANVRDAVAGISLATLAEMAVRQDVVDPGYLSAEDWCGTLLTWWKHGAKSPFQIQLRSGCSIHLSCSDLGDAGRVAVAIEVQESSKSAPATQSVGGPSAPEIYALLGKIGAATHGLSDTDLNTEQAACLDAICEAGEGVVALLEPHMDPEPELRQVG